MAKSEKRVKCYAIDYVFLPRHKSKMHQSLSFGGEAVTICLYLHSPTAPINANQEKGL